jgi:hypothetical protein
MKTVLIEYATISPAALALIIEKAFENALCSWHECGRCYFEFSVYGVGELAELEDVLAEYM